jgi:hypothetical protein
MSDSFILRAAAEVERRRWFRGGGDNNEVVAVVERRRRWLRDLLAGSLGCIKLVGSN